jgi:hypothetical protein
MEGMAMIPDKTHGWIGVDLDGTLAHYTGWTGWNQFGEPIPRMATRVRQWLKDGVEVRIVTARVVVFNHKTDSLKSETCKLTGRRFSNRDMINAIQDWTQKHLGQRLKVTCSKDLSMIELWDDRAIQVVANTGLTIADEYEAQIAALKAKGPTPKDIDDGIRTGERFSLEK